MVKTVQTELLFATTASSGISGNPALTGPVSFPLGCRARWTIARMAYSADLDNNILIDLLLD